MLTALVSNVTLLVWLSNFAQSWLPCARLNPVARIPWAPSTAQILKVTLIEWLLKLTLLALHQVFTPIFCYDILQSCFLWLCMQYSTYFSNLEWVVKIGVWDHVMLANHKKLFLAFCCQIVCRKSSLSSHYITSSLQKCHHKNKFREG